MGLLGELAYLAAMLVALLFFGWMFMLSLWSRKDREIATV